MAGPSYIDDATGMLAGPWAECICWGVRFERTNDWRRMPEYSVGEPPVVGILQVFAATMAGQADWQEWTQAAALLQDATHAALDAERSSPGNPHELPVERVGGISPYNMELMNCQAMSGLAMDAGQIGGVQAPAGLQRGDLQAIHAQ